MNAVRFVGENADLARGAAVEVVVADVEGPGGVGADGDGGGGLVAVVTWFGHRMVSFVVFR